MVDDDMPLITFRPDLKERFSNKSNDDPLEKSRKRRLPLYRETKVV